MTINGRRVEQEGLEMPERNTGRTPSWMPISRATTQMWALDDARRSMAERRPRHRRLRAITRWMAAFVGR